jgi:hypothetical protein
MRRVASYRAFVRHAARWIGLSVIADSVIQIGVVWPAIKSNTSSLFSFRTKAEPKSDYF